MRKQHPWSNEPICRIDVTGFLSIMVVLLSLFWAPEASRADLPFAGADLPTAAHSVFLRDAHREDAMFVTVQRDGKIFFGYEQVSSVELTDKIGKALTKHADRKIYLKSDRHARYRDVLHALEGIRNAGIENIAIVTSE